MKQLWKRFFPEREELSWSQCAKWLTPFNLFLGIMLILTVLCPIMIYASDGQVWEMLLFADEHDSFMDHFNSVKNFGYHDSLADMYMGERQIYPPLVMLVYYLMYRLVPSWLVFSTGYEARLRQEAAFPFMMQFVLISILLAVVLYHLTEGTPRHKWLVTALLFCSTPMIYLIERGNIIYPALLFITLFFLLKDSPTPWKREVGSLCLAVAAGLKLYPALFGLLLINRRQWKQGVRCMLYGVLVSFIPLLIIGVEIIPPMIAAWTNFTGGSVGRIVQYQISFHSAFSLIGELIPALSGFARGAGALAWILGILAIGVSFLHRDWRASTLLGLVCACIIKVSYIYALVFLIPSLIGFLNTAAREKRVLHYCYAFFFLCLFAPFPFIVRVAELNGEIIHLTLLIQNFGVLALTLTLIGEGIYCGIRQLIPYLQERFAAVKEA